MRSLALVALGLVCLATALSGVDALCGYGNCRDCASDASCYWCTGNSRCYYGYPSCSDRVVSYSSDCPSSSLTAGAIVGIVLGIFFCIAIVVTIVFCFRRRRLYREQVVLTPVVYAEQPAAVVYAAQPGPMVYQQQPVMYQAGYAQPYPQQGYPPQQFQQQPYPAEGQAQGYPGTQAQPDQQQQQFQGQPQQFQPPPQQFQSAPLPQH